MSHPPFRPQLGLQGSVLAWRDPWEPELSDRVMRTGTGRIYPPQDPAPPSDAFARALKEMGCDFYVHHVFPGAQGDERLLADMEAHGIQLCLGNEYGNINGPWVEGTNRYDVPEPLVTEAARRGLMVGLLYDEPAHLQINAGQYRKDGWFPHWGGVDGAGLKEAERSVVEAIRRQVKRVRASLAAAGLDEDAAPLIAEHVFPVMFHVHARAGMDLCPKVMKESFQSLQLATALGAAKQYNRALWMCVDLWGPDVGPWFIRTSGFPGHSPEEYASALRLAYYMAPTRLFTENVDPLLRYGDQGFSRTAFGEAWEAFALGFAPENPLAWRHYDATPDIAIIHSDDSNYGQNARLYGDRESEAPPQTQSQFHIWHLVSHGTIPAHGSCMHIPGFDFPRHRLRKAASIEDYPLEQGAGAPVAGSMHPLFYPVNNALAFDEFVTEDLLRTAKLIFVAGARTTPEAIQAARRRAELGATVLVASWLAPEGMQKTEKCGEGLWLVTDDFLSDEAREAAQGFLGDPDCWRQRFGRHEVRIRRGDKDGFTLDFEIREEA